MLTNIKLLLYKPYAMFKIWRKFKHLQKENSSINRLYLLNIPSHGNLGDHLLSVAELQFFKDNFPDLLIVPVTSADLYFSIKLSLSSIRPNDIICITGGGFLGSMYEEEERFLSIIKMFPNNKIVVLPQTIYYENNKRGQIALQKAINIYKQHKFLYITARDQNTYNILQNTLMKDRNTQIAFTPDLGLYLCYKSNFKRVSILWCMRKDLEKNPNNIDIINSLKKQTLDTNIIEENTDTYVPYSIPLKNEYEEVLRKVKQFSQARLVITDRLHGMIYSAITETPVIAIDNVSGKVGQVYEKWLAHLPYVKFISQKDQTQKIIQELLSINDCQYKNDILKEQFKPIIDFINA